MSQNSPWSGQFHICGEARPLSTCGRPAETKRVLKSQFPTELIFV